MVIRDNPPDAVSIIHRVVARPNSAFVRIQDDHERYWRTAVVVFLGVMGLGVATSVLTFGNLTGSSPSLSTNFYIVANLAIAPMIALLGILTIHMIARWSSGQRNLRKTFTAFFLVEIVYVPFMAIHLVVMVILLGAGTETLTIGYAALTAGYQVVLLPGAIWGIILAVKALKVLNNFGTLKALGVLVVAALVQAVWAIPLNLVTGI